MLAKTHLSITILFVLLFFSHISHKLSFVIFSLVATLIPDVDSQFSELGKKKVFRIFQLFLKHRGILHSILFLIILSVLLALFYPVAAFPFFLGYGLHLISDSFTVSGVRIFYPFKRVYSGVLRTGTRAETSVFVFFLILDIFVLASIIFSQSLF